MKVDLQKQEANKIVLNYHLEQASSETLDMQMEYPIIRRSIKMIKMRKKKDRLWEEREHFVSERASVWTF